MGERSDHLTQQTGATPGKVIARDGVQGALPGTKTQTMLFGIRRPEDRPVIVPVSGRSLRHRFEYPDQVEARAPLLGPRPGPWPESALAAASPQPRDSPTALVRITTWPWNREFPRGYVVIPDCASQARPNNSGFWILTGEAEVRIKRAALGGIAQRVHPVSPTSGRVAVALAVPASNAAQVGAHSATEHSLVGDAGRTAVAARHLGRATSTLAVPAGSFGIALTLEATD